MNIIQAANAGDGLEINRIACSVPNFSSADCSCVRELWSEYAGQAPNNTYQFCVCRDFDGESLLGFACYGKHALTESTFDLYWIAVDPALNRRGVGTDLLVFVEQQVLAQQGTKLIVETSTTEPYRSARKFYRHNQYQREAIIRDFYAPGDHLIIFTKKLLPRIQPALAAEEEDPAFEWAPEFAVRWGQKRYFNPG